MVRSQQSPEPGPSSEEAPILQSTQVFYNKEAERISNLIDEDIRVSPQGNL